MRELARLKGLQDRYRYIVSHNRKIQFYEFVASIARVTLMQQSVKITVTVLEPYVGIPLCSYRSSSSFLELLMSRCDVRLAVISRLGDRCSVIL